MGAVQLLRETARRFSPKAVPAYTTCAELRILGDRAMCHTPEPLPPEKVGIIARPARALLGRLGEHLPTKCIIRILAEALEPKGEDQ